MCSAMTPMTDAILVHDLGDKELRARRVDKIEKGEINRGESRGVLREERVTTLLFDNRTGNERA